MKFSVKAILATAALSVLLVTPVFATEKTLDAEVNYIINHETQLGNALNSYVSGATQFGSRALENRGNHALHVVDQYNAWVVDEEANYINYLQKLVVDAKETERIKQQNVASINDLAKVNPSLAAQMLPNAQAELVNATNARVAAEAAIPAAQARFAQLNLQLLSTQAAAEAPRVFK